ncbi:MAG: hypothetical protein IJK73_01125 [Bacteroidales bacterium]|nr:hypothetical protein [Bacteroidales bacterium]
MKQPIEIITKTSIEVKYNGLPASEVISEAIDLAHQVLIDLSIYRQEHGIEEHFDIEGWATEFLDKVGD